MSYGEFLLQWYNLIFLAAGAAGLAAALFGDRDDRDPLRFAATAISTALVGLTLNGAIHDLRLGEPAAHAWWVLPSALVAGALLGWGIESARNRWFPPVRGVRWNPPGQEGAEARVVSSSVEREPASGRAQWQDEDGVLTLVRCHTAEDSMKFGARVRLEEYDEDADSYLVVYRSE